MTKRAIALGFFDGVHAGHRAVLREAAAAARENGWTAAALTFDRHPAAALTGAPEELIQSLGDRIETLKTEGAMDEVLVLPFDEQLRSEPWRAFAERLVTAYDAGAVSVGYDFRFGERAQGTPELLRETLAGLGCSCRIVPRVDTPEGTPYGTRYLRQLIKSGGAEQTAALLGRPFSFTGTVQHGKNLGHTLGFPTMNVPIDAALVLPRAGVYVSRATIGKKTYGGVTNIAPDRLSETFVFDFAAEVYGQEIRVELLTFLREMKRWAGWEALAAQVERDKAKARAWLSLSNALDGF